MDIIDIAIAKSKSTVDPSYISSVISNYLNEHGVQVDTDSTLSIEGTPADSKAVGDSLSSKVGDVQIDGVSVVTDGIAEIPKADYRQYGIVLPSAGLGTGIAGNGSLAVVKASTASVKTGTNDNQPIVPNTQHVSTFYGLAKVAGVDERNSNLSAGQYSEEAKVAIQKMLGIYEAPWELINEETFTHETEANYVITQDSDGNTFELTDVVLMFETPRQSTVASKGQYGDISFNDDSNTVLQVECGSWTQNPGDSAHGVMVVIKQDGNMIITSATSQASNSNNVNVRWRYADGFSGVAQSIQYTQNRITITSINIIKVMGTGHYCLYGKRKWN